MGKVLIIAEKPSVARDIAKVLKVSKKGEGYIYNDETIVSWAIGHLVTLADPEEYDETYKKWAKNTLPILPSKMKLIGIKNTKTQLKILKKIMNSDKVDSIVCATDSGREGELIFRYIYEITKCKKPFKRLWISSMTESAIKDGFANLKDGSEYDNLYYSAKCRSEADWLVGMNATRAYTLQYNSLLSVGRVQTPTLALMVEKQKEINAFVIEEYFELQANMKDFFAMRIDEKKQTRIAKKDDAKTLLDKINKKNATVTSVEKEEKRQIPPLLYDLTELQRECNKKFGFSAKKTLDVAQSLYEKQKLITYPRTDSRYLSDDMEKKARYTLTKLKNVSEFLPHIEFLEKNNRIKFTKRIIDNSKVSDHHAIIPTEKIPNFNSISSEEANVYRLIASRFISIFHLNYTYEVTKAYFDCEGECLLAKGTVITEEGWLGMEKQIVPIKKKKTEEQQLPILKKDDVFTIEEAKILDKKTTPPPPYTENTLLSAMENAGRFVEDESIKEQMKDNGLGTPATRASVIERLLAVGYIIRKGKSLIPTEKGMSLIEVVPKELSSPQTTGKWEKGLSSISKGDMTEEKFMGSIKRYVQFLVHDADTRKVKVTFPEEEYKGKGGKKRAEFKSFGECPLCGNGKVHENTKSFYCSQWKNGCSFTIWKNTFENHGVTLSGDMIETLLKDKKIPNVVMTLPQTKESGKGTIILSLDKREKIEVMDFTRD